MLPKLLLLNQRLIFLALILTMLLIPLALNVYVRIATSKYRYENPEEVPEQPIAIVFGAGVWEDGTPILKQLVWHIKGVGEWGSGGSVGSVGSVGRLGRLGSVGETESRIFPFASTLSLKKRGNY